MALVRRVVKKLDTVRNRFRRMGYALGKVPRPMARKYVGGIHRFKQTRPVVVVGNAIGFAGGAFTFQLSDLGQSATFTSLFDQYRIMKVKLKFVPRVQPVAEAGTSGAPVMTSTPGYWLSVIDYDDGNAPATIDELQQYDRCKINVYDDKIKTFTVKPHIALAAYSGAFTSFMNAKAGKWIDVASPSVAHYGYKYAFPPAGSSNSRIYDVMMEYFIELKNAR